MTLDEAAHTLYAHFGMPRVDHPWLQSIGIAETTQRIHVLLVRRPRSHEQQVPKTWEGFTVETRLVGRIVIGGLSS